MTESVTVVVGTQWGDEGKGKLVDLLSNSADLCVRFQGGGNAGHTVVNTYGEFKLHLIPCLKGWLEQYQSQISPRTVKDYTNYIKQLDRTFRQVFQEHRMKSY